MKEDSSRTSTSYGPSVTMSHPSFYFNPPEDLMLNPDERRYSTFKPQGNPTKIDSVSFGPGHEHFQEKEYDKIDNI